jgi:RNA polymerase sigma-70 factor (ECF subfamily)
MLGVMQGEAEALARCSRGEDGPGHEAFRVLYDGHRGEIEAFLRGLIGERSSVDDALQDTFVRLHRSLKGYDTTRPLRPYVLAIARNVAMDVLRTRAKLKPLQPRDEESLRAPASGEREAAVAEALEALEAQHRSLILMRWVHELKQEEIAVALGCTARTVRNKLRTASALFERELVRREVLPPTGEVLP